MSRNNLQHMKKKNFTRGNFYLLVSLVGIQILLASCEPKEFDWSDLGVSLTGPKSAITGGNGGAPNNLRILVSPQRRIAKK